MEEGLPLKKRTEINERERGALIVRMVLKEKNSKKNLIVWFRLRFSIT